MKKTQISFAVTAKLISVFVFATRILQSLCFLNSKFQASSHLLWLYSPVCVGPGRKPRRPVFSRRGSYFLHTRWDFIPCFPSGKNKKLDMSEVLGEVRIDKSVPRVTVCITRLCRVMPNSKTRDRFVYPYLTLVIYFFLEHLCE